MRERRVRMLWGVGFSLFFLYILTLSYPSFSPELNPISESTYFQPDKALILFAGAILIGAIGAFFGEYSEDREDR